MAKLLTESLSGDAEEEGQSAKAKQSRRVVGGIQSRINILQKTLVFKTKLSPTNSGGSSKSSKGHRQSSSMASRVAAPVSRLPKGTAFLEQMLKSKLNKRQEPSRCHQVVESSLKMQPKQQQQQLSTPYGRNIRKELAEQKFKGLAALFQNKQCKIEKKVVKVADDEEVPMYKSAHFDRPPGPNRASRRLPSRWLTKDGLIVPDRKEELNIDEEPIEEEENQENPEEEAEDSQVQSSTEEAEVMEEILSQIAQLNQQQLSQRRISLLLRDFVAELEHHNNSKWKKSKTNHHNSTKSTAYWCKQIVFANKCLLLSGKQLKSPNLLIQIPL